jgi:L-ascorbate metabolism protein UlaG (beta-lactamase superfamily)
MENGFKVYHMGDTGLFTDMKFIADYYKPDVVLMPIGGNFTNPLAKGTATEYLEALGQTTTKVSLLKPGEKQEF